MMSTARAKLGLAMRGRFAVDQPTINGRSCLDPDSIEAASVPVAVVAQQHDTSVREIEAHYAAYILDHSDAISRRALLETPGPLSADTAKRAAQPPAGATE